MTKRLSYALVAAVLVACSAPTPAPDPVVQTPVAPPAATSPYAGQDPYAAPTPIPTAAVVDPQPSSTVPYPAPPAPTNPYPQYPPPAPSYPPPQYPPPPPPQYPPNQCGLQTGNPTCDACIAQACCQQAAQCAQTPECGYADQCMTQCDQYGQTPQGQQCYEFCYQQYPTGAQMIDQVYQCMDTICAQACPY